MKAIWLNLECSASSMPSRSIREMPSEPFAPPDLTIQRFNDVAQSERFQANPSRSSFLLSAFPISTFPHAYFDHIRRIDS